MDLPIIISTQFPLLLGAPMAQRGRDVAVLVLAADHEADLAGGVGGNGRVGVFDGREEFLAGFLELGDQGKVEPLVLACGGRGLVCWQI